MSDDKLRLLISSTHPVFGEGYRQLTEADVIAKGDETACVSCLLSLRGDTWTAADFAIGKTVKQACEETGDMDGNERVFRRHNPAWKPIETMDRSKMQMVLVYEDGATRIFLWNPVGAGTFEHVHPIGAVVLPQHICGTPTHWMELPLNPVETTKARAL